MRLSLRYVSFCPPIIDAGRGNASHCRRRRLFDFEAPLEKPRGAGRSVILRDLRILRPSRTEGSGYQTAGLVGLETSRARWVTACFTGPWRQNHFWPPLVGACQ